MLRTLLTAAAAAVTLALAAPAPSAAQDQKTVIVGSTNFTEQLILANMYEDVLTAAGVPVKTRLNLGSREIVFPALMAGEINALPEYSGAVLAYLTDGEAKETKPQDVLKRLRQELPEDLVALEPSPAQDRDTLVVRAATAERYGLDKVSDLKGVAEDLVIGGPPEMKTREAGLPGLRDVYGLEFKAFRSLDAGGPLTQNALKNGDIDVARMFTTQGAIDINGWVSLEDDKNRLPAQNLIPILRKEIVTDTVRERLNALSAALSTKALTRLNAQVGVEKRDPEVVAEEWLRDQGLI